MNVPGASDVSGGASFAQNCFVFLTFVYAAAVHLVIHHALESGASASVVGLVAALIAFMFSDWASRTRLPSLLEEGFGGMIQVVRTALEVMGVYLLVFSFVLLIHPSTEGGTFPAYLSAESLFAFFLLITWAWDWLILKVMGDLDVAHLAEVAWKGNPLEAKAVHRYLARFERWRSHRARELERAAERLREGLRGHPNDWRGALRMFVRYLGMGAVNASFEQTFRAFMQFLAMHILYANALAGFLILWSEWSFDGASVVSHFGIDLYAFVASIPNLLSGGVVALLALYVAWLVGWRRRRFLFALVPAATLLLGSMTAAGELWDLTFVVDLIGAAGLVFLLWVVLFSMGAGGGLIFQKVGACAVSLSIVLTYSASGARELMLLLAVQQVVVNAFLHFATEAGNSRATRLEAESEGGDSCGEGGPLNAAISRRQAT